MLNFFFLAFDSFAALPMDEGDCLARMQQHMLEEHAASEAGGH